jgi:GNAT superfamily N-acetyltransferase
MVDVLHPASPGDIDRLLPLMQEYSEFDRLQFDHERARRAMLAVLADPRLGRVWFIREGGENCGYVALCFGFSIELGGRDAFVDELYLREPFRGRGLGTLALEAVADAARAEGVVALHLEVRRDNADAQRYYERVGFVRRDRYFLLTRRL